MQVDKSLKQPKTPLLHSRDMLRGLFWVLGEREDKGATTLLGVTGGNEKMGELNTYVHNLPRMRISEHVMRVGDRASRAHYRRTSEIYCFRGRPGYRVRGKMDGHGLNTHKESFVHARPSWLESRAHDRFIMRPCLNRVLCMQSPAVMQYQ